LNPSNYNGSFPVTVVNSNTLTYVVTNYDYLPSSEFPIPVAGTPVQAAPPRGMGQLVKVVSISGNVLTLDQPMYYGFSTSHVAQLAKAAYDPEYWNPQRMCGLEDFTVTQTFASGGTELISMQTCDSCWVKNVVSTNNAGDCHVQLNFSYRCEIRDSTFAYGHMYGGGEAYGVACYNSSCNNLVAIITATLPIQTLRAAARRMTWMPTACIP
jgi:hypothetical protein